MQKLTEFERAYLDAALWSTNDESTESGGEPLDRNYSIEDIAPEALARLLKDCQDFQETAPDLLLLAGDSARNGHDFWLTRNRHGAGFWDRGYTDNVGEDLTDIAHDFGSVDLYVGDDGLIYCS